MHVLRPDVADWLHALKLRGYRVYLLSNLAKYSHDYVRGYPFFRELDGGVFSYQERVCKPDERIYRILLERYALRAEETVFLDDSAANVAAAERCGIRGIVFTDFAAAKAQLEELLRQPDSPEGKGTPT
jgi:putative hydrolase of the HAD superfamily